MMGPEWRDGFLVAAAGGQGPVGRRVRGGLRVVTEAVVLLRSPQTMGVKRVATAMEFRVREKC